MGLGRVLIEVRGKQASQSVEAKTLSKVAITGELWLLDQVKLLFESLNSIRPHLL